MTEADLNQYRALKHEIKDINRRIEENKNDMEIVQFGTVKGSDKNFPYTPKNFHVSGIDPDDMIKRQNAISDLIRERELMKTELVRKLHEIEQYINEIPDSSIRTIFRMHFIDGENQIKIAMVTHYTQGRISQIIKNYFKTNIINNQI